jgi:hypothetical protein
MARLTRHEMKRLTPHHTPHGTTGLANGWADGTKTLRVWPEEAGAAFAALGALSSSLLPRGFMFWDIADEGMVPPGSEREMWMARGLNSFLHTRSLEVEIEETDL